MEKSTAKAIRDAVKALEQAHTATLAAPDLRMAIGVALLAALTAQNIGLKAAAHA